MNKIELPKLSYGFDALEPYIDARTMEVHHDKHHQAYVDKLNEALDKHPELGFGSLEELLMSLDQVPEDIRTAVRNNGGGVLNHNIFWRVMGPRAGGDPNGAVGRAILEEFRSFSEFRETFGKIALNHFGSGWAWLVLQDGKLKALSLPNQDAPISDGMKPVLPLDLWEHAYYLKFQNRRPDYVKEWWNAVNWDAVNELYATALKS